LTIKNDHHNGTGYFADTRLQDSLSWRSGVNVLPCRTLAAALGALLRVRKKPA
jgi:hypothetical protein